MARNPGMEPRALDAAIEEHRVYFEVERELEARGTERAVVALRVLLWATIPRRAGALPGARGCRAAVATLEAAAAAAIARAALEPAPDVETFQWRLYASRQEAGADEVRLGVNVRARNGSNGPEEEARERALARLRRALEEVGVFEGSWRPPDREAQGRAPGSRNSANELV